MLMPRLLNGRIAKMFDSLQSELETTRSSLRNCYWVYGSFGILGLFGALVWNHGPSHVFAVVCYLATFVLAFWFLAGAIRNGPPTQQTLNRRMLLLMWLALAPGTLNFFLMK